MEFRLDRTSLEMNIPWSKKNQNQNQKRKNQIHLSPCGDSSFIMRPIKQKSNALMLGQWPFPHSFMLQGKKRRGRSGNSNSYLRASPPIDSKPSILFLKFLFYQIYQVLHLVPFKTSFSPFSVLFPIQIHSISRWISQLKSVFGLM